MRVAGSRHYDRHDAPDDGTGDVMAHDAADLDRSMAALADGDRTAFNEVFASLWPVCRQFARRTLNDDALGDDAAQSALEKLFFQAPRYERGKSVNDRPHDLLES